jgi:hypothetical protein
MKILSKGLTDIVALRTQGLAHAHRGSYDSQKVSGVSYPIPDAEDWRFRGRQDSSAVAAVARGSARPRPGAGHLLFSIFGALFGIPVGLGLGYIWGKQMATLRGLEPDSKQTYAKIDDFSRAASFTGLNGSIPGGDRIWRHAANSCPSLYGNAFLLLSFPIWVIGHAFEWARWLELRLSRMYGGAEPGGLHCKWQHPKA